MDIDGPERHVLDLLHPLDCARQNELVHFAVTLVGKWLANFADPGTILLVRSFGCHGK